MQGVLIAESRPSFHQRLTELLSGLGFTVVGHTSDPMELRLVISRVVPDVLVLDDSFLEPIPGTRYEWPAVEVEQLRAEFPEMSIVVLSALGVDQGLFTFPTDSTVVTVINKEDMLTELPRAIERFLRRSPDEEREG